MKAETLLWNLPGAPANLSIFRDAPSGMLVFNRGIPDQPQADSRLEGVLSKMRACTAASNPAVVLHDAKMDEAFAFPEKLAGKYLRSIKILSDIDALALTPEVLQHYGGQQAVRQELIRVCDPTTLGFNKSFTDASRELPSDVDSPFLVISSWLLQMKEKARLKNEPVSITLRTDNQVAAAPDAKSALRNRLFETIPSVDARTWSSRRGNTGENASAALGKHRSNGRLFAVDRGGSLFYPEFQFTEDDLPRPIMKDLLATVPADARGWPLLSWFDAPNAHLDGRKPREVVASRPDKVLKAAQRFYGSDE
jgi:hypothetical protein